MELVDININDPESTKYNIKFLCRNTMVVTKELLKSRNVPDMNTIISHKKKLITSYFKKYSHLCNRNSNPGMTSYLTYILNTRLD